MTAILSTLATFVVVRRFGRDGVSRKYQVFLGAVAWFVANMIISIVFYLFEPFDR
jgi:hypothetical protein